VTLGAYKLEIQEVVDQKNHPALTLVAARPELFARQGAVVATWRQCGSKTYGPYYRLNYREGGRQHSIYLGIAGPIVSRVRDTLEQLQKPLQQSRALNHVCRQINAALRVDKARLAALLRPYGLRLKGLEVRGWRFSPLHRIYISHRPKRCKLSTLRLTFRTPSPPQKQKHEGADSTPSTRFSPNHPPDRPLASL
jgi:hypothetical protein